jgi:hypothetical protein
MTTQSTSIVKPHRAFSPPHRRTSSRTRGERDLAAAAIDIRQETERSNIVKNIHDGRQSAEDEQARIRDRIERRLVTATWTLRRLPDRERSFLRMGTMLWPESVSAPGTYARQDMSALQARRNMRIDPADIDAMQPTLDLLLLLPDVLDRQILFWAAWHQDGEPQAKLPWAKIRRSLGVDLSRWSLKRRNDGGLAWLARLVLLQK